MDDKQKKISVLMFPWLSYGHISPFLELAKKLTKRNFYIYFCSTPVNLNFIKPKISPKYSNSIQFVELHLPSLPELPPHYHTTNGLPPHLMNTLKKAFDMSRPAFAEIIKTLNPNLLIGDYSPPWAPALAWSNNVPAISFVCFAAVVSTFATHALMKPGQEFPFPGIHSQDFMKTYDDYMKTEGGDSDDTHTVNQGSERSSNIVLIKSFRELEGKIMDYYSSLTNQKMIPTGPLVHDPNEEDNKENDETTKMFMEWLSKKNKSSTVFVSFGSEYYLPKQQREEIAHGLELSGVNFIWVIRFPGGEEIELEEALPQGFLQRVGERGLVVERWAPQAKILQHSSIGGLVCHCGWSTVMESLKFGVPIIAMPMQLDHPLNARVLVDAGVALEVSRNKDGSFEREEIAKVIKEVVFGNDGEILRRKATEMGNLIMKKGEEEEEIDELVEQLIQLCGMKPGSS